MAQILILSTYDNPQPYGDRTGQVFGTMYDWYVWNFDTETLQVTKSYNGLADDFQDSYHLQDYSYPGEFFDRCEGTTRIGYVHDRQGGFTTTTEENSAQCSLLVLDFGEATNETAAGDDGTATIQAHGGIAPLTAFLMELGLSQPATSGQPNTFPGLPASRYTLRVTDSSAPTPQQVQKVVAVGDYVPEQAGCQDEYAIDYNPQATSPGACTYAPNWRSAWGPAGVAVRVAALPGQVEAFVAAELFIGFREGHPLHEFRPLSEPIGLRATVMPSGYATFHLGPFLRPQLGSPSEGGYRLDINSETVDDLYVGYELRRTTGEMLEHGYALNAAVPDEQLTGGLVLTAFKAVPTWPGFDWKRPQLTDINVGQFGSVAEVYPATITLPCPTNPLPVAWLNPLGGWDFWVFQGKPTLADELGEGQAYNEATSGERRYTERGEARSTVQASSGVFKGADLMEGLRTLWRSPQVWYKPDLDGDWVPVTLGSGSFPAGRKGVLRQEVSITFTEALPQYQQGQ
jgi:hypothetical protein